MRLLETFKNGNWVLSVYVDATNDIHIAWRNKALGTFSSITNANGNYLNLNNYRRYYTASGYFSTKQVYVDFLGNIRVNPKAGRELELEKE
jgi:hypothetical protein